MATAKLSGSALFIVNEADDDASIPSLGSDEFVERARGDGLARSYRSQHSDGRRKVRERLS